MMISSKTCFLAAGALTAAALFLPLWGFRMSAPQYPGESLHLRISPAGITGDVQEIQTLQQYIGVSFPAKLEELRYIRPALVLLCLLLAGAAFTGAGGVSRCYRYGAVLLQLGFLGASMLDMQWRLYGVGHHRAPHPPIQALQDFTPLFIGPTRVGNFTMWSYPHAAGFALALALLFALLGLRAGRKAKSACCAAPALQQAE